MHLHATVALHILKEVHAKVPAQRVTKLTCLEPEGQASEQDFQSVLHALLHGTVHAHAGPVTFTTQDWGHNELEAIRAACLQLTAAQQVPFFIRIAADCEVT